MTKKQRRHFRTERDRIAADQVQLMEGDILKKVCRIICMVAAGVLGEGRKKEILADL